MLWGLASGTAAPARLQEDWRERSGCALLLRKGELVRVRQGVSVALTCTDPAGTGRVLDLALDPAGLAFVAAERGLFVLGPWVDVLDPVERTGLAPAGTPTSIHVDAERRVWLATEREIGVLDPSFFHGRTLQREDLPGAGPYRVEGAPGGGVRLGGTAGELLRLPGARAPPRLTSVRIDGVQLESNALLERDWAGFLRIEAAGAADGGASFRYRFDRHQVWRELAPVAELRLPSPGRHTLEVIALDQDLDRSEPWRARLHVANPVRYGNAFLLGSAALVAVLCLGSFTLAQRARGRMRPWRAVVSTGLVLVLALQVLAGIDPHGKGWPFMGFDMYTRAYARDEIVYEERVVVLRADGSEQLVNPQSAGFVIDEPHEILGPLIDGGAPVLRAYLNAWSARNPGSQASGLQVQARRARLTRHGPVAIAPLVLAHWEGGDDDGDD